MGSMGGNTQYKSAQMGSATVELVLGDITEQCVDAIVNAANARLAGGGGVDGAVHRRGGPAIMEETRQRYPKGCPVGSAVVTGAGALAARYVFHAVGPQWCGGRSGEEELLRGAYRKCLELAVENRCASIAFPSISTGAYGYPVGEAAAVALQAVRDFCREKPEGGVRLVRFVLFSPADFAVYAGVLGSGAAGAERKYVGKPKPNTMSINILADSSGSMANIAEDMSGSLNQLMAENKDLPAEVTVTYSIFSTDYMPQFAEKPIAEVPQFRITPTNSTALLESATRMIEEVDARFAAMPEHPEKVMFVIVTDGMENASRPGYTRSRLFSLIRRQTEERNWVFLYFGANQDAIQEAASMGIRRDRAMYYETNARGVHRNHERLSRKMEQLHESSLSTLCDIGFDAEDREA
jgi:O-acetyl-ADP-ribose deacetylase (regulator of RNase III)